MATLFAILYCYRKRKPHHPDKYRYQPSKSDWISGEDKCLSIIINGSDTSVPCEALADIWYKSSIQDNITVTIKTDENNTNLQYEFESLDSSESNIAFFLTHHSQMIGHKMTLLSIMKLDDYYLCKYTSEMIAKVLLLPRFVRVLFEKIPNSQLKQEIDKTKLIIDDKKKSSDQQSLNFVDASAGTSTVPSTETSSTSSTSFAASLIEASSTDDWAKLRFPCADNQAQANLSEPLTGSKSTKTTKKFTQPKGNRKRKSKKTIASPQSKSTSQLLPQNQSNTSITINTETGLGSNDSLTTGPENLDLGDFYSLFELTPNMNQSKTPTVITSSSGLTFFSNPPDAKTQTMGDTKKPQQTETSLIDRFSSYDCDPFSLLWEDNSSQDKLSDTPKSTNSKHKKRKDNAGDVTYDLGDFLNDPTITINTRAGLDSNGSLTTVPENLDLLDLDLDLDFLSALNPNTGQMETPTVITSSTRLTVFSNPPVPTTQTMGDEENDNNLTT